MEPNAERCFEGEMGRCFQIIVLSIASVPLAFAESDEVRSPILAAPQNDAISPAPPRQLPSPSSHELRAHLTEVIKVDLRRSPKTGISAAESTDAVVMEKYIVNAPARDEVTVRRGPTFLSGLIMEGLIYRDSSGRFEVNFGPSPWPAVHTLTSNTVPLQVQLAFSLKF